MRRVLQRSVVGLLTASLIGTAVAQDGSYRGQMRCAAIPGRTGELVVAISMTVKDGVASYQRNIIALDGIQVLGQESGTGSIDTDGSINLKGGASTKLSTFTVEYKGKVSGSHVALTGTQMHTVPRQFTRDCTISVDRD